MTAVSNTDSARAHYEDIVRNLSAADIDRIEHERVTAAERAASPKLEAACVAWEALVDASGGARVYSDKSPMHYPV